MAKRVDAKFTRSAVALPDASAPRRPLRSGSHGLARTSVAAFAVLLSGCAALGLGNSNSNQENNEGKLPSELLALVDFVSLAQSGEASELEDPRSGTAVRVVAGRRYQAASGKLCRRFAVTTPPGYAGFKEGLACRDESGRWQVTGVILNPENLNGRQ